MPTINSPIEDINKIGKATAKKLQKLNIDTVRDLLAYYPARYHDYTRTFLIEQLRAAMNVNTRGVVEFIQNKRSFRSRLMITEALVGDATGTLKVVWFNQPFIGKSIKAGDLVSLSGPLQDDFAGLQMVSPEYEKITGRQAVHTTGLVPVYHLTAGLTNKQLRFLIQSVIGCAADMPDDLPPDFLQKYGLCSLPQALRDIHFPADNARLGQARQRLQFDELFLVQLASLLKKTALGKQTALPVVFFEPQTKQFVKSLPFVLTDAQKKAAWEILQDMQKPSPMSRLLEGDVGSGKTVTAAIAMYNAALNTLQSVLLAPTEILAQQHYATLCALFKNTTVTVGLCTRTQAKIFSSHKKDGHLQSEFPSYQEGQGVVMNGTSELRKKDILSLIEQGETMIVVGTHALLQEKVQFKRLALAVIDEQHRFGVSQRQTLREKSGVPGTIPHLLSMTATPIPRSLAQAIYGDLDLSIINQAPAGRKPVKTYVVPEAKRAGAYEFVRNEIKAGRQAFVVCPLIAESDKLGVKSVEAEYKKLTEEIFKDLKIEYLHGRMQAGEKEAIMQTFLANEAHILVSTSVIEVGVDVPNAAIMLIEGAERFGLAQLHQFRGRVGRSKHQSYCLLFPTDERQAAGRLQTFAKTTDGFALAEADLKLRGPGEVYGTAQKGFPQFKIATLNDPVLLKTARSAAQDIMRAGIDRYPVLRTKVSQEGEWVVG